MVKTFAPCSARVDLEVLAGPAGEQAWKLFLQQPSLPSLTPFLFSHLPTCFPALSSSYTFPKKKKKMPQFSALCGNMMDEFR